MRITILCGLTLLGAAMVACGNYHMMPMPYMKGVPYMSYGYGGYGGGIGGGIGGGSGFGGGGIFEIIIFCEYSFRLVTDNISYLTCTH